MPSVEPASNQAWRELVEHISERDGTVELTALGAGQDSSPTVHPTYRTRLLVVHDDGSMVVEHPTGADAGSEMRKGAELRLRVVGPVHRLDATCRIHQRVMHRLNARTTVGALHLDAPHHIGSAQRRRFYRVDTAATPLRPVTLMPLDDQPAAEGFKPLEARMLNISGGGIGLGVTPQRAVIAALSRVRRYSLELELPTLDDPLHLAGELVHLQPMTAELLYLGLRFDFPDKLARRHTEDQIVRFCTSLQRRQIRRSRGR